MKKKRGNRQRLLSEKGWNCKVVRPIPCEFDSRTAIFPSTLLQNDKIYESRLKDMCCWKNVDNIVDYENAIYERRLCPRFD